jgi:hypothetical protein
MEEDSMRIRAATKATMPTDSTTTEGTGPTDGKTMQRKDMGGAVEEVGVTAMALKATNGAGTAPADGGTATRRKATGTERKVTTVGTETKPMVVGGEGTSRKAVVDLVTEMATTAAAVVAKAPSGSSLPLFSTVCSVAVKEVGVRAVDLGVDRETEAAGGEDTAAGVRTGKETTDLEGAGTILEMLTSPHATAPPPLASPSARSAERVAQDLWCVARCSTDSPERRRLPRSALIQRSRFRLMSADVAEVYAPKHVRALATIVTDPSAFRF